MIADSDIANLCLALYQRPGTAAVHWDHLDTGEHDDGICWALYRALGADIVILRGSITLRDWLRDFTFGLPFGHRDLGVVHAGFLLGMTEMYEEVRPLINRNVIVAGHSLGAARADVLTALMLLDGRPPMARVVFGEPMPGFQSFADIIRPVPCRSYCNGDAMGHDLVTDVPFADELFPYVHPSALISVSASPPPEARGTFRYHDMALYALALKNAVPAGAA